jgi:heme exporter protein C
MKRWSAAFPSLVAVTAGAFAYLIVAIFLRTPTAQLAAGGLAQKIFYFHVPAAYAMYLSGFICCVASAAYLISPTDRRNALAQATAECAVAFGALVMTSGPLWAKQAWGVYWTWEPRLTTSLLCVLVYAAVVVLRATGGADPAPRKFAAALGVLGTVDLPFIHFSVTKWGGHHPNVIGRGGGGLSDPAMLHSLVASFGAMTLLAVVLIWSRTGLLVVQGRVERLEQRAVLSGALEGG